MKSKTRLLVLNALFIALLVVLQLTGIGLINVGVINITFYCTIIAIGTMVLGLKSGLVLGFAFGTISLWSALRAVSGLVPPLVAANPLLVAVMCFVPRLLVPVSTYYVYKLIFKSNSSRLKAAPVAAVAGSLTNTVLYLGLMLLGYALTVADYPGLLATVGGIVLFAGIPEAIVAAVVAPPIVLALGKIYHPPVGPERNKI